MIKIQDILSLTEFHRHSREHIAHLHATGRPQVLTVNGRAELVVQDAAAYQKLLERLKKNEATLSGTSQLGSQRYQKVKLSREESKGAIS